MTERVGGVAALDHLKMFKSYGYQLSRIERPTGRLVLIDDIDQLLGDWGDRTRIEDLVALRPGSHQPRPT